MSWMPTKPIASINVYQDQYLHHAPKANELAVKATLGVHILTIRLAERVALLSA
jgi:hypothetical protein